MPSAAERLVAQWKREKVALNAGATEGELDELRALFQFEVPEDIRSLYVLANGMPDLVYDSHQVAFWSIAKICDQRNGGWKDNEIGFADFLVYSWRFIFRPSGGLVTVVSENVRPREPMKTLGRFADFLEQYLSDPRSLGVH